MNRFLRLFSLGLFCMAVACVGTFALLKSEDYFKSRKQQVRGVNPIQRTPEQIEAERIARTRFQELQLPANPFVSTRTILIGGPDHGMAGQLINEAFLIAAREDFSLPTRDDYLRETGDPRFDVAFEPKFTLIQPRPADARHKYFIDLRENFSPKGKSIRLVDEPIGDELIIDIAIREAEKLTTEDYPRLLEQIGFQKPHSTTEGTSAVDDILLATPPLDLVLNFVNLRRLHSALRLNPQSPQILATLSEHYSILGSLCDLHWGQAGKIFKIRGLLYARRGLQVNPDNPRLQWSLALSQALIGLEYRNVPVLELARQAGEEAAPPWGPALEAFATWNETRLQELADSNSELARYFRVLSIEMCGTGSQLLPAVTALMQDESECYRASVSLAHTGDLGIRRSVEHTQLEQFLSSFPESLQKIEGLSSSLVELAQATANAEDFEDQINATAQLITALKDASLTDDRTEPSLGVLAALAEDLHMIFAVQILNTLKFHLGVDCNDRVSEFKTLLAHHPAKVVLDAYRDEYEIAEAAGKEATAPVLRLQSSYFCWSQTHRIPSKNGYYSAMVGMRLDGTTDTITPELLRSLNASGVREGREAHLKRLRRVSPDCPQTRAYLISMHWDEAAPHIEEWLKDSSNPNIYNALGAHYNKTSLLNDADFPLAEKYYKRFLELDPSFVAYSNLAYLYRNHGDHERYRQMLKESLSLPSFGLQTAKVHEQLAKSLMKEGRYVEARPHAMAAADSYSGWGLDCANQCLEGLGEWELAEEMIRNAAHRYETWYDWYYWCRRTGHGDLEAAREFALSNIAQWSIEQREKNWSAVAFYFLEGELDEAASILHKMSAAYPSSDAVPSYLTHILVAQGKFEEARELWVKDFDISSNRIFFQAWFRTRENAGNVDPATLEFAEWLWPLNSAQSGIQMHIGRMLHAAGRTEEAIPWLQKAESALEGNIVDRTFAGALLRELNVPVTTTQVNTFDQRYPGARSRFARFQLARENAGPEIEHEYLKKVFEQAQDWTGGKFWAAHWALKKSDFDTAEPLIEEILKQCPDELHMRVYRARIHEYRGRFQEAKAEYEKLLELYPDFDLPENNLAWILAASPDDQLRDGAMALKLADQISFDASYRRAIVTLLRSAAHAENGDFERAIQMLEEAQREKWLDAYSPDPFLKSYRDKQPYREIPKNTLPQNLPISG
ncbi:tetratricopeptide repeat protein [Planctomicrobium sp. SH661]|uniref:tetratricopeptide repeat protein n=1 Tax=Planctomicrobium sp. SH661 TaxID=3448124 RepID=UPI003F5CA643